MGLFFEVLESLNHPALRGTVARLEAVLQVMQEEIAAQGVASSETAAVVSVVGEQLRSHLQHQSPDALVKQLTEAIHPGNGSIAIEKLVPAAIQADIVAVLHRRAQVPLNRGKVLVPQLLSAVLEILALGSPRTLDPDLQASAACSENPILTAFLQSDRADTVDMGQVYEAGWRFLQCKQAIASATPSQSRKGWFRRAR